MNNTYYILTITEQNVYLMRKIERETTERKIMREREGIDFFQDKNNYLTDPSCILYIFLQIFHKVF